MLTLGDEKMSKSVGNVITLRDLLARHGGEVLRYALLSGNYRSPLAWSDDLLKQAQASLDRIYQALLDVPPGNATSPEQFRHAPVEAFPAAVDRSTGRRSRTPPKRSPRCTASSATCIAPTTRLERACCAIN